jgi:MFS family permease
VYDVRPASDDRPYFYNFFRWRSLPLFRQVYGSTWFRKLELGYVVIVGVLIEVVVVGSILILLPLLWLNWRSGQRGGRLPTAVYFLLLGLSYMLLEIVLISKFTHFLGDPILSAGGVVSAFLVASGLGSLASRRLFRRPCHAITAAVLGIVSLTLVYAFVLDNLFSLAASWATASRFSLAILLAGPLAFLMGLPFPNGLAIVQEKRLALVPWAWGVNGFASVAGPPLGILLAVSSGFRWVFLLAAALYGCAGLVAWRLPRSQVR